MKCRICDKYMGYQSHSAYDYDDQVSHFYQQHVRYSHPDIYQYIKGKTVSWGSKEFTQALEDTPEEMLTLLELT